MNNLINTDANNVCGFGMRVILIDDDFSTGSQLASSCYVCCMLY